MAFLFRVKRRVAGKVRTSKRWDVRYKDPRTGRWVTAAGYEDKSAAQNLLARLVRESALFREGMGPAPERGRRRDAKTLAAIIDTYGQYLADRGRTAKHAAMRTSHCRRTADVLGWLRVADLNASAAQANLAQRMALGMSERTAAHWATSLRAFGKWLVREKLATASPFADLVAPRVVTLPRPRRVLSAAEFARLLKATVAGRVQCGLAGPARAMLYRVAAGTGFRRSELASLTPASFASGTVTVAASATKNRKPATLPIAPKLARAVKQFTRGIVGPIWPGTWSQFGRSAKMLRADLKAAGLEYQTADGVYDFHSLRAQYITDLARSGASPQEAQRLARHSDPRLTASFYTRLSIDDLAAAVNRLEK